MTQCAPLQLITVRNIQAPMTNGEHAYSRLVIPPHVYRGYDCSRRPRMRIASLVARTGTCKKPLNVPLHLRLNLALLETPEPLKTESHAELGFELMYELVDKSLTL